MGKNEKNIFIVQPLFFRQFGGRKMIFLLKRNGTSFLQVVNIFGADLSTIA
jgi:hypothetical protein